MVNSVGSKRIVSVDGKNNSWWEGDRFLYPVIKNNFETFSEYVDMDKNILTTLPICRALARKEFLDYDSMSYIVSYCRLVDPKESIDYDRVGSFFYEEMDKMFYDIIVKQIKEFIAKSNSIIKDSEVFEYLKECLWSLNGATCSHYVTNGLKVYDCFE